MKTKIKRHGRSVISVILAVCLLISCMTVGLIATDAANVTDSETTLGAKADDEGEVGAVADDEEVGATYYLLLGKDNDPANMSHSVTSSSKTFTLTADDFGDTSFATGTNYYVGLSSSSSYSNMYSQGGSSSASGSGVVSAFAQGYNRDSKEFHFAGFSLSSVVSTVTVECSSGSNVTYTFSASGSGGSGGGDTTGDTVSDDGLIKVLKLENIYIYHGDKWGSGTKYVKNGTSATSNAASGTSETITIDNSNCYVAHSSIPIDANYSISNEVSSWEGMKIESGNKLTLSQAGKLYYMWKNNNVNALTTKTSSAAVTWTTDSDTISPGAAACNIAATASGTTGAGRSVSVKYFYTKDDENFYTFNPDSTASLTPGTYTIYAAAYDNALYVAAATTATLVVKDYVATSLTLQVKTGESTYGNTLALSAEDASAEVKITATSLKTDNVSYKLYDSKGDLVANRFVTDGASTVTFNVTPNVPSETYYATVEPTDGSAYVMQTSNEITITNSAYEDAKFRIAGRIQDGTTNNWSYATGLDVNERVSGKVFSYFYDPAVHGGSSADPVFRVYSSTACYEPTSPDQTDSDSTKFLYVPTSKTNKHTSKITGSNPSYYFKLPDNYNCYTIYIEQDGSNAPKIWCEKSNSKSVKVVAKDCSVRERGSGTGPHYTMCDSTGATYANTVLTGVDVSVTTTPLKAYIRNENTDVKDECGEVATVYSGKTIRVTTTITNETFKSNYYVAGFCFNGETNELLSPNNSGVYTTTYTIPDDLKENYLEITPIYFLKDTSKSITFYVEGFDDAVKASWGNTIAVYPYYGLADGSNYLSANQNAFGGYPGQPMIFYGGRYYSQIPIENTGKDKNGATSTLPIQGITLSNYYWDDVHSNRSNGTTVHLGQVTDHRQTYDYDDFYRIYDQKEPTTIIFAFKYETTMDNGSPTPSTSSITPSTFESGNGWEDLTDYYGRKVDLFGNDLTGKTPSGSLYVVSDGYDQNYTGHYATEWYVYNSSGTFIAKINPSALLINDAKDVTGSGTGSRTTYVEGLGDYKAAYETLKATYLNYDVKITYEKEILNSSSYRSSKGLGYGEEASRSDGRWYYSKAGDTISADIKIQYNDTYYVAGGDQTTFTEDTPYVTGAESQTNQGTHTNCRAYFTNTAANQENQVYTYKMASGSVVHDETKNFTFTADTNNSDYVFLGWFLVREGKYTQITKLNAVNGESSMSSNATFVARFVKAPTDKLRVKHTLDTTSPYNGTGSPFVSVYVFDTLANAEAYLAGDATKVPVFFKEDSTTQVEVPQSALQTGTYYVYIRLKNVPAGNTHSFYEFLGGESTKPNTYFASRKINHSKVLTTVSGGAPVNYYTDVAFPVSDITSGSDNGRRLSITSLAYQSRLKKITYAITYGYDSYRKIYNKGTSKLKYIASDAFTEAEFTSYLQFAESTVKDENNNDKTIYGTQFQSEKKDDFFAKKAPYVDNFMETRSWDFTTPHAEGYQNENRQYTATIASTSRGVDDVNVEFHCPYLYSATTTGVTFTTNPSTGHIEKLPNGATHDTTGISAPYLGWYCLNKEVSGYLSNPVFFSAPKTIYDGDTAMTFKYWSVKNIPDASDKNTVAQEYTRCYSTDFNLTFYKDSIVEPIYDADASASHQDAPSVVYLETSRNQWNNGGNPVRTSETQGDRLFIDFLLTFDRADKLQLNTVAAADRSKYDTGLLLDRIALIDGDTKSAAKYAEDYDESDGKAAAETFLRSTFGNDTTTNAADGQAQEYRKSATAVNKLDNKNRIEKYFGFPNIDPASGKSTGRKNYVYRAYAYMMEATVDENGQTILTVKLSDPVYFTFYDMASIEDCTAQL